MPNDGLDWERLIDGLRPSGDAMRACRHACAAIRKVKVAGIRPYLPAETPIVTQQQRAEALRNRRIAAQMRIIW